MSTEITRKDRLAINMKKMQINFGSKNSKQDYMDIVPETYILPE